MADGRDSSYWVHKIWQLLTGGDPNATGLGISIDPGDIQIGAVEIKNNTDDTRAKVTTGNGLYVNLRNNAGTELGTGGNPVRTDPTGGTDQPVSVSSLPLPAGAASEVTLSTLAAEATLVITNTAIGDVNETAPATDTASSGLNGRLQRIAQRITSLIALLPAALGSGTTAQSLKVVLPTDQVAIPTKDAGPSWTASNGIAGIRFTSADATGSASVTDAPTSGQKLVITDIIVSVDTAMRVDFHEESTAATVLFTLYMAANTAAQITPRGKVKLPTINKKLFVDTSVAGNVVVTACYYSEA